MSKYILLGRDRQNLVWHGRIVDRRDETGRKVLQPFETVERLVRLDRDAADRPGVLFEASRGSHHRPGGAESRHEVGDLAADGLEDFAPGAVIVRERVRRVRVLVRVKVLVRLLRHDRTDLPDCAVRALHRIREDDLGSEGTRDVFSRLRDVQWHHESNLDPERSSEERIGDAGVPARRVDQDLVAGETPVRERVLHHPKGGSVLHAAARIRELELRVNGDVGRSRRDMT
jgi:hypothetical protein